MKKIVLCLLCLALLAGLCACGDSAPAPAPGAAPVMQAELPGVQSAGEAETGEEDAALAETLEKINALKDQDVAKVYELVGEPQSAEYAPSCLGPGEDGQLQYEGFLVFTYKEGDREIVLGAE